MLLKDYVNVILFEADLLNTSCVANESQDEYINIAMQVSTLISLNDYVCEEMLIYVLSQSLSLDDDDNLEDYVNVDMLIETVKNIDKVLNEHFRKPQK